MMNIPDGKLPTLALLNASVPPDLDARQVAKAWFSAFSTAIGSGDVQAIVSLLLPDSYWRDMLAMTWDFRTFHGQDKISTFLKDQLPLTKMGNLTLRDDDYLGLSKPYPDVAWISMFFDFETGVGIGSGIIRLVPIASGDWKAHVVYTNLENLKGFPEKMNALRDDNVNNASWAQDRREAMEFKDKEPTVLIIGGSQSGLDIAARLKALGVSALIVEKTPRIGDSWRTRYEALCLHDPVWYDHMPYMPFPSTWPVFSPAGKLANWLEYYAEAMELPVWTSTTVTSASQDANNMWHVSTKRGDGQERTFIVKHLVFATGLSGGTHSLPKFRGLDKFKGTLLHSSQHKKAHDHAGKKVAIIGACTSAHDIARDYYGHGVDVTMIQRGPTYIMSVKNGWGVLFKGLYQEDGPPPDIADRLTASFPHYMTIELSQRQVKDIAELDKDTLAGLRQVGFKLTDGIKGTGFGLLAWSKAGGYYLDTGTSQLIIDKKIKLKNDSGISEITENGIKFENGSELPADVIVFATGLADMSSEIRQLCDADVNKKLKKLWGLNSEGEIYGVWRDLGVPNLWMMCGNLALCRFHSKHIALQIKAKEEGVFGRRYSNPNE
ncbi:hypothetical protein AGABI2DRAFT_190142 [Agaricus bisporus var. bisporus H97]|uniref:hypothetical protein n=1 Tax=Agaricus bisporus var. bisporus (strain H97 / ATCC MYA-4626 / FGSC 10389) TaxID=936046 RepID=UPI00029F7088|nr:hypothetical protein AGABI2DRAFT_190142 [Agaricus bisporus var. bisporus H97]EKV49656.1 hypothetical protein AGABI2DRAFT_190142 [Agaricus bisporus var. bisporus H97]